MQITLDVSALALASAHVSPGQFVQLRRPDSHRPRWGRRPPAASETCFATLASPPGGRDGCFEFLVDKRKDPLGLATINLGHHLRISPVMGNGLDYAKVVQTEGDLHIFVDAPQGFAAVRSLIEWGVWRSLSGEGANRTNHVTVYYAVPSGRSLPYADCFSPWSVYGVNVVPLAGTSVMEYLSTQTTLGASNKSLTDCFAMACVTTNDTYEALFSALILFGFRRSAIQRFTQEVIARESAAFDDNEDFEVQSPPRRPPGMPEDAYQQDKRNSVEREIWQSWARVREGMRADFERKWAAQSRVKRDRERTEADKQQAWASWFVKNKEQWTRVSWDSDQWGQYWSSWKTTNEAWTSKKGSASSSSSKYGQNGYAWDQQESQEYWDWVGRGTESRRSSAPPHGSSSGNSTGRSYQERYGGSQGWSSANNRRSGYQKGGYRYQYEEPNNDKSTNNQGNASGYSAGGNRGSGTGWSGWNRNTSGRRASSSGGQRNWNTNKPSTFGDLDFYVVLGIDSGASHADIKRAYRRKAMEHHPDRNLDKSEEAHVKMKQIVVAWSVLKDEGKRKTYDAFGPGGL